MLLGSVDPVDAALLIAAGASAGVAASGPLTRALAGAGGSSTELSEIYVRPGKGSFGVGLITIRPVPAGTPIIQDCAPKFTKVVQQRDLLSLPKEVRLTVHELFDCLDDPAGTVAVPTEYEQAIPLISFINHSTRPNCEYDPEYHAIGFSHQVGVSCLLAAEQCVPECVPEACRRVCPECVPGKGLYITLVLRRGSAGAALSAAQPRLEQLS